MSIRSVLSRSAVTLAAVLAGHAASAAITLNIEMNPDPPRAGEVIRSQLTVANNGGSAVANVVLRATVPNNVSAGLSTNYMSIAPTGCNLTGTTTSCDPGDIMTFTLGTLPAGAATTVSVPFFVAGGAAAGTVITLPAEVLVNAVLTASASDSVTVDDDNGLSLALDENLNGVPSGGTLTYTLTYGNRSVTSVTAATLSLPLPAGATLVSATGGGLAGGGAVSWNIGTLLAGQAGRQQAVITLPGTHVNGNAVEVDPATITGQHNGGPETARADTVTVIGGGALGLAVEANPDPVRASEQLRTEIAVTNRSGMTLLNVVLRARQPENTNSFSAAQSSGTAGACNLQGGPTCDPGDLINYSLGNMFPETSVVITLPPFIAAGTESGRVFAWEALVTANGNHQALATRHYAVDSDNALTLAVDDSPNATPEGGVLTYVLTWGNRSAGSVTGATLSFPLPEGTTLLSSTGGVLAGNVVNFNLGTIAAGQGGRRQMRVQLGGGLPAGSLIDLNGPQISGTSALTGFETSRVSEVTPIEEAAAQPALLLTSRLNPNPASPGTALTGSLTVLNSTTGDLANVVVRVRVPDLVTTFPAASLVLSQGAATGCQLVGGGPSCDATDKFTWTVGTLLAGAEATLSFPTTIVTGDSAPANGRLLFLYADGNDATGPFGTATDTLLVGTFTDGDLDGIPSVYDNCLDVVNPNQLDADNDGFGNPCDGDLNDSGLTTAADFNLLRTVLNQTAGSSALAAAADMNGSGLVTATDFNLLRSRLNTPPGPSSLAP